MASPAVSWAGSRRARWCNAQGPRSVVRPPWRPRAGHPLRGSERAPHPLHLGLGLSPGARVNLSFQASQAGSWEVGARDPGRWAVRDREGDGRHRSQLFSPFFPVRTLGGGRALALVQSRRSSFRSRSTTPPRRGALGARDLAVHKGRSRGGPDPAGIAHAVGSGRLFPEAPQIDARANRCHQA